MELKLILGFRLFKAYNVFLNLLNNLCNHKFCTVECFMYLEDASSKSQRTETSNLELT